MWPRCNGIPSPLGMNTRVAGLWLDWITAGDQGYIIHALDESYVSPVALLLSLSSLFLLLPSRTPLLSTLRKEEEEEEKR